MCICHIDETHIGIKFIWFHYILVIISLELCICEIGNFVCERKSIVAEFHNCILKPLQLFNHSYGMISISRFISAIILFHWNHHLRTEQQMEWISKQEKSAVSPASYYVIPKKLVKKFQRFSNFLSESSTTMWVEH